jgi:hypothetical protein
MIKLTEELRSALAESAEPLRVKDETTQTNYVLVEEAVHRDAMLVLAQQHDDAASIARGLAQLEAGLGRPLAEVDVDTRQEFGFAPRP